jgi:glycosyltransferase involved in cell wall biosynthesis
MNNNNPQISIVSPVYKAEKILEKLVEEIQKVMVQMNLTYEIILVDDRSPDDSWEVMMKLSAQFSEVRSIRLSRNFGQHPAIMAGLSLVKGEWVVVMDCDLQDQPMEIKNLYAKAMEGYDIVLAKRENRQDNFFKRLSSKCFYTVFNYLSGIEVNNEVANFGIYKHKVIKSTEKINDYIKFFPLFINWVGFKSTSIVVLHSERDHGKSSYSFFKLLSLAFNTIISFSDKPLKIFTILGLSISSISFLFGCYYLIKAITGQISAPGFSSLIISIWLLSGIIISAIGIVGIYLGKTFNQVKNRPIYIIDEKIEN